MAVTVEPDAARAQQTTVLIGFADALAAPETAWSLLAAGVRVVAFSHRGTRPSLRWSREVEIVEITSPADDADAALADLCALLDSGAHDAVMPLNDASVWLCSAAAARGAATPTLGPTGGPADLALDKRLQLAAAERAGLAVPATRHVDTLDDLFELSEFPLLLKPALPVRFDGGRLTRGSTYACGNRAELDTVARRWAASEPLLSQPLIGGVGEGLFGLAGPHGLTALSAHRRVRMMNPQGSGSSACISTAVDEQLAAGAERMLREVGWRGMFMLEFLRGSDGTAWFMELNGRTWGSMALARRLGLEYPAWAVRQLADPGFTPAVRPAPGQVCRHLGREVVHLLMVMRGPKSVAVKGWPSRRRTLRDVLRFKRTDRWYNCRRGDLALFLDDTVTTVRKEVLKGKRR
jgi:predicted ATP-grasp superfamily ATP-dependent carboligase